MTPRDKSPSPTPRLKRIAHPRLKQFLSIISIIAWTIGCILVVQLLLALLFRFLINTFRLYNPIIQTLYSVLTYVIAGAIIIFLPPKLTKKSAKDSTKSDRAKTAKLTRSELGFTGWPTWTDLGLAPIGFIVYAALAALVSGLFTLFPWFNASEAQSLGFSQFALGFDRVLAFFTLVIVAPIAEELIFRGYLYIKLKNTLTKKSTKNSSKSHRAKNHAELIAIIIASLLTSLVFAMLHGQWNVGVNVFVMSLVLCALREITGTIYAGILMHIIKNAVAFVLVFVIGSGLF